MVPHDGTSASRDFGGGTRASLETREEGVSFDHLRLKARLVDCGLELSYEATGAIAPTSLDLPGMLAAKFTIPWEVLILRYPVLGRLNPRANKHGI